MAFSYCPHCGFKNMYSLQSPKFCGGCGEGLSLLSAAKQTRSTAPAKKTESRRKRKIPARFVDQMDDDPDGLDIQEVPNISKLSYSIEIDKNKFNLKDIIPLEDLEQFQEEPKSGKRSGRSRKK